MFTPDRKPLTSVPVTYRIRVEGDLHPQWSDWFGGLRIESERRPNGSRITVLEGALRDQAELRGVLIKLLDLNLVLISVQQLQASPDT